MGRAFSRWSASILNHPVSDPLLIVTPGDNHATLKIFGEGGVLLAGTKLDAFECAYTIEKLLPVVLNALQPARLAKDKS